MHILNNGTHALVFPPRCGTRWIAEKLYHKNLINTFGPSHDFKYDSSADVKIFMFVRNPFTRERSVYRWLIETKQITLEDLCGSPPNAFAGYMQLPSVLAVSIQLLDAICGSDLVSHMFYVIM